MIFIEVHVTLRAFLYCSSIGILSTPDMDPLLTNSFWYPLCLSLEEKFLDQLSQSGFLPKNSIVKEMKMLFFWGDKNKIKSTSRTNSFIVSSFEN